MKSLLAAVTVLAVSTAQADTIYVDADCGSDCCSIHGTPGCDSPSCEAVVCDAVPLCCDVQWDAACVTVATVLCDPLCTGGDGTEGFPFCNIQTAIDHAVDTDEVVVADGTYTGPGNRDLDFGGKLITVRSANGPANCIIDSQGSEGDSHRGFYFHSGETAQAVVKGFTITNGAGTFQYDGAGILGESSSPTISDCVITGNASTRGGGIFWNVGSGGPTITNCVVTRNTALVGGGIASISSGSVVIVGCIITDNIAAQGGGGGVVVREAASFVIMDCQITDNVAQRGGGISVSTAAGTISNTTVTGNQATGIGSLGAGGGGIEIQADVEHGVVIEDCLVTGNTAVLRLAGGIFFIRSTTIRRCTIAGNQAGGAGGGIYARDDLGSSSIVDCTIAGNSAQEGGGGIFLCGDNISVINCLVLGNETPQRGGGLLCRDGPAIANCTVVYNTAGSGGGMATDANCSGCSPPPNDVPLSNSIVWGNAAPSGASLAVLNDPDFHEQPSTMTVSYCDVEGGEAAAFVETGSTLNWGDGNIDADPLFVDPANDDYRVSTGSPCIDAGNNTAVPMDITTDLDGNPRFVDDPGTTDTGSGTPPIVDMGAYEFQIAPPCPWDCDGGESTDGTVGIVDFLAVLAQWGSPGSCDFDGGGVGITDFLALLANWGPCP